VSHILVIANETAGGSSLVEALKKRAEGGVDLVTVVAPVNVPSSGYVVYEDTRRAAAGRRLDRTLAALREAGISAHGFVLEEDPVSAARDALAIVEPRPTEIIVSTHPEERSGWMRKNVVDRIRKVAGDLPVEHVVVDVRAERDQANVLVVANETIVGPQLLEKIRERAAQSPATFLLVAPQDDPSERSSPEAERRLRRALAELRGAGIDAHGQIAHPDAHTAAMQAIQDERVDEIIVSTYPGQERSSWLRGDLVERLRKDAKVPVTHVEVPHAAVEAATT
jgi:hypothetical protein